MKTEKKLVSVIVPVYNVEKYLSKCIESILAQSYNNIEIILINDGSEDNSLQVCNDYSNKSKKIRVVDKENSGVSSTRNLGIDYATGKYLCFVDSDDYIEKDYIANLVNNVNEDTITFCGYFVERYTNGVLNFSKVKKFKDITNKRVSDNIVEVFQYGFLAAIWNKIYDVEVLKNNKIKFNEKLSLGEDLIFNLEYLKTGINYIESVNIPLYHYIKRGTESLDNRYRNDFMEIQEKLFLKLIDTLKSYAVSEKNISIIYEKFFSALVVSIDNYYDYCYKKDRNKKNLSNVVKKVCQSISNNRIIYNTSGKERVICLIRYNFIRFGLYKIDYLLRNCGKKILKV